MAEATQLKKGRAKTGGRKKGTPNKATTEVKTAILKAFDAAGGEKYLVRVAKEDPKTFCTLLGRVLPAELKADINVDDNVAALLAEGRKRVSDK